MWQAGHHLRSASKQTSHIQAASNIQTINPLVGAFIILEEALETNANIIQS